MKSLVIIPAFNEQENILHTISDLKTHCSDMDYIIINDCSEDKTLGILKNHHFSYLSLPCNLGIGGGVQTGYQYAAENDYDIAIQFDGDGQHQACYLHDLIKPIENGDADIVIGSRFIEKEGFQSTGLRRFGIHFLSHLIHFLCHVHISDVTSGMRAVNKRFIEQYAKTYAQDYPEPEAIVAAAKHGARIMEVPVKMKEREKGKSSISPLRSLYYMIKVSLALIIAKFSA